MTELEAWEAVYPKVRSRGTLLVAISPSCSASATHHRAALAHLPRALGPRLHTRTQFGIAYTVPPTVRQHYRSIFVNVPCIKGDETWRLPLPATSVLSPDGIVRLAEAHADHRVRPDPAGMLLGTL